MSKFDEIKALYEQTMSMLSNDPQLWRKFLSGVCNNYKLRFDEQVLLFAQRPGAAAVATFDQWFKMYRPVKKGQDAIRVFEDENGISKHYKRYYDISDTRETELSHPVPIWTMADEYQQSVAEAMEQNFGQVKKSSFEDLLISSAQNIANANLSDYNRSILQVAEDSFLEDLGNDAVLSMFDRIVTDSVAYTMLSRLGFNAENYIDTDNFSEIVNFNTVESLFILGKTAQQLSKIGLITAAQAISKYKRDYKEDKNEKLSGNDSRRTHQMESVPQGERSAAQSRTEAGRTSEGILQQKEQAVVHSRSENMDIRTESHRSGGRAAESRNVHSLPQKVPQGGENGDVRGASALGNSEQAPQRTVGEMPREGESNSRESVSERRGNPSAASNGLVEIHTDEREHFGTGERNGDGGNGLQLSNSPFSQDLIDRVLLKGNNTQGGKIRIYNHFSKKLSSKENIDFLKEEYGWGGTCPIIENIDENHDGKGIHLSRGLNPDSPKILLKWNDVEKRIRQLIAADRYLTENEKEELKQAEEKYNTYPRAEIEEDSTSAFLLPKEESTYPSHVSVLSEDDIYSDRFFLFEECERIDWM